MLPPILTMMHLCIMLYTYRGLLEMTLMNKTLSDSDKQRQAYA